MKKFLYILLLVLLCLPIAQTTFPVVKDKLYGWYPATAKPELTTKTWFDGSFQSEYQKYLNDSCGFHNSLLKLRNQIYYLTWLGKGFIEHFYNLYFNNKSI